jgi:hypothetical protein
VACRRKVSAKPQYVAARAWAPYLVAAALVSPTCTPNTPERPKKSRYKEWPEHGCTYSCTHHSPSVVRRSAARRPGCPLAAHPTRPPVARASSTPPRARGQAKTCPCLLGVWIPSSAVLAGAVLASSPEATVCWRQVGRVVQLPCSKCVQPAQTETILLLEAGPLKRCGTLLPEDHPATASSLNNLATRASTARRSCCVKRHWR